MFEDNGWNVGCLYGIEENLNSFSRYTGTFNIKAFQRQNAVCVASKEDKLWLKACISADETVPFEAIKQHINNKNQTYEIY